MLLLTSTSDIVRVVTSAAANVLVHASWIDNASGTITPGRTNTAAITTATNTTVVAAPAGSTQRNVKGLYITNSHASATTVVTVQHYDGTTYEDLMAVTLMAGENLYLDAEGVWHHMDLNGGEYQHSGPPVANLGPIGCIGETIPREVCTETNTTGPTTGVLYMQAIYLKAGQLVSSIGLMSATTAASSPTHFMVGLFDLATRALLATSADQLTAAWAANTWKNIAMTTPYRVPTSGLYYVGFFQTASTMNTWKGQTARTGGQLASQVPILGGMSASTGLTTALPNPAGAITANGLVTIYAAVF